MSSMKNIGHLIVHLLRCTMCTWLSTTVDSFQKQFVSVQLLTKQHHRCLTWASWFSWGTQLLKSFCHLQNTRKPWLGPCDIFSRAWKPGRKLLHFLSIGFVFRERKEKGHSHAPATARIHPQAEKSCLPMLWAPSSSVVYPEMHFLISFKRGGGITSPNTPITMKS